MVLNANSHLLPPEIPSSLVQGTTRAAKACFRPCSRPHHRLACQNNKRCMVCMQSVKNTHSALHAHCSSVTPCNGCSGWWFPPGCCQRQKHYALQGLLLPTYTPHTHNTPLLQLAAWQCHSHKHPYTRAKSQGKLLPDLMRRLALLVPRRWPSCTCI